LAQFFVMPLSFAGIQHGNLAAVSDFPIHFRYKKILY